MINIFLCDHDPDILKKEIKYIENLCEKMEYEFLVEGFSDTKIALQKMREAQDFCDILITDIEMPELSGLEMAKMLRAEKK
ncbi:MAG: response regulator, partial [Lachnospiraceae bacterium]|nr:response regulator [Lachnospiraceae bacterium]